MSGKMRIMPFDVPGQGSAAVVAGHWLRGGIEMGERTPLKGWGYSTPLVFSRTVTLDSGEFRKETGLPIGAQLVVLAAWEVDSALHLGRVAVRRPVALSESAKEDVGISVNVPSPDLAEELVLRTCIVLGRNDRRNIGPFAATEPGSVLWSDESRLLLEGRSSRLPIAVADFSHFDDEQKRASWFLWTAPGWLHRHPSAGLAVYLNAARPSLQERLAVSANDEASALLRSVFRHEVGRAMLERALDDAEFQDDAEFPDKSSGRSIRMTLELLFRGQRISEIRAFRQDHPDAFERVLQARHRHLEPL